MMIYNFLRKLQSELDRSTAEQVRLDGIQCHDAAHKQRVRAATLQEVLTWAGFENCEIAVGPPREAIADGACDNPF